MACRLKPKEKHTVPQPHGGLKSRFQDSKTNWNYIDAQKSPAPEYMFGGLAALGTCIRAL